jgi:Pyridoxamine 5'-phosphate oxidase
MGKVLPEIGDKEAAFIASQKVFFVATAPLAAHHHVSVSPKANNHGSIVVLDPHTVAYADLTGSGAETAAHVLQNGRMTLMFCNLEAGLPKILRLLGTARVIVADAAPQSLLDKFAPPIVSNPGFRAIYQLDVHRISASCGFSMPVMKFERYRNILDEYAEKEGRDGMFKYSTLKNSYSIDGLPSLALLRKNAPAHVEPTPEEGYIFGKVVLPASSVHQKILLALRRWLNVQRMKYQTLRRVTRFDVLMTILIFAAGVCVGQIVATSGNHGRSASHEL